MCWRGLAGGAPGEEADHQPVPDAPAGADRAALARLAETGDLDLPEAVCVARNKSRPERDFGAQVIRRQRARLRKSLRYLQQEGFRTVHVLSPEADVASATITRTRLYSDLRHETGPFDVIGDVHGCRAELEQLLTSPGCGPARWAASGR